MTDHVVFKLGSFYFFFRQVFWLLVSLLSTACRPCPRCDYSIITFRSTCGIRTDDEILASHLGRQMSGSGRSGRTPMLGKFSDGARFGLLALGIFLAPSHLDDVCCIFPEGHPLLSVGWGTGRCDVRCVCFRSRTWCLHCGRLYRVPDILLSCSRVRFCFHDLQACLD